MKTSFVQWFSPVMEEGAEADTLRKSLAEALAANNALRIEVAEASSRVLDSRFDNAFRPELAEALAANSALRTEAVEAETLRKRLACAEQAFGNISADKELLHCSCEVLTAEKAELQAQLKRSEVEVHKYDGQRAYNKRVQYLLARSVQLVRLERALSFNIAREMSVAIEGRILEKVTEKRPRSKVRFVVLDDAEMSLKWCHPPGPPSWQCKSLDLQTVIRIDYGGNALAPIYFPGIEPWMCFSLCTSERSFDFVCPDDDTVQCFMLAISRLCRNVPGAIISRRQFLVFRGRCKLQTSILGKGTTLTNAVLQAVREVSPSSKVNSTVVGPKQETSTTNDTSLSTPPPTNPFSFVENVSAQQGQSTNPFSFVEDGSAQNTQFTNPFSFSEDASAQHRQSTNPFSFSGNTDATMQTDAIPTNQEGQQIRNLESFVAQP